MTKRIIVYGSLRRDESANNFLRDAKFVEETRVPGYDLFALGWYPGIKTNPVNKEGFVGEVFEFEDEGLLADLDSYEGYRETNEPSSLFVRRTIEVSGEPTFVYLFNGETNSPHVKKIESGNWKDR
jgi:gamma-glutamylcyclotransferase (GGCT)/AIG2-like uncharacterized protein YtfP